MILSLFVAMIAGFVWILPTLLQRKYGNNLMYPWLLVISRLLAGISRGCQDAVEGTFFTRYTLINERKQIMRNMSLAVALGYVVGPGLGIATLHLSTVSFSKTIGFDEDTAPGWIQCILSFVVVLMFSLCFTEDASVFPANRPFKSTCCGDFPVCFVKEQQTGIRINVGVIFLCLFVFFTINLSFSLTEALVRPLTKDLYNWSFEVVNLVFVCVGALNLGVVMVFDSVVEFVGHRILVVCSLCLQISGYFCLVNWTGEQLPLLRFLVGYGLIAFGFPIGRIAALGLYQNLLQHVADV
jgi:hypothetical protein